MPKASQEEAGQAKPRPFQKENEETEQEAVSAYFDGVGRVVAIVKSSCTDALVELTVFLGDVFLVFGSERRVLG